MMRVLLLLVFMFSLSCWAAPLDLPAPSGTKPQQEHLQDAKKTQEKSSAPTQTGQNVPPLINIVNNASTPGGEAQQAKKKEENPSAEWWTVGVAIIAAGIAALAALIAAAQACLFVWQLSHMKTANETAAKAAQAALNQSESIMHAERAYVKLGHVKPGLKKIEGESSVVSVKARNMGRTPAQVTDIHIDFALLDYGVPLPKRYPFRPMKRESFPNGILMPNEWLNHAIHVKTKEALVPGKQLWFFGEVDYIDVFGRRWRGGYARKYWDHKDDNLHNNTEDRDNFDRERLPDEGRDWDKESKAAFFARKGKLPS